MRKIDFARTKILFIFVAVCICMASFMGACSDDGSQNTKNENSGATAPVSSDGVLDKGKETEKPETTIEPTDAEDNKEMFSTAVPVETNVPTAENALATENVVMTPNVSATEDVDNSGTVRPIETGKPSVTPGPIETTAPVITSKPTEKPTITA